AETRAGRAEAAGVVTKNIIRAKIWKSTIAPARRVARCAEGAHRLRGARQSYLVGVVVPPQVPPSEADDAPRGLPCKRLYPLRVPRPFAGDARPPVTEGP